MPCRTRRAQVSSELSAGSVPGICTHPCLTSAQRLAHGPAAAAAAGTALPSPGLPPSALSLFGMLLGTRTNSVLFFGFWDKFDF